MASIPNRRGQFYSSKRTGKKASKTGGDIVEITFGLPTGRIFEVVKDTNPLQWRIHTELEHGFPDVTPNKQLGKLLAQVVDAIAEEDAHAAPTILPGTEIKPERKGGYPDMASFKKATIPREEAVNFDYDTGSDHRGNTTTDSGNHSRFIAFAQSHGYTGTDHDEWDEGPIDDFLESVGIYEVEQGRYEREPVLPIAPPVPNARKRRNIVKPTIKPVVPIEAAPKVLDLTHHITEAAPPVSPSEFDPCPELSDAERPSGVLTHKQEMEGAHQERAKLLKEIQSLTNERDAARAETARTIKNFEPSIRQARDRIGKLNLQVEEQQARIESLTKSDEDGARTQHRKIKDIRKGEVAALLITELTGILCTKEMDSDERERMWKEFYRRLTVQTEDYPTRLTPPVRDIAHKLFRSAIKQS